MPIRRAHSCDSFFSPPLPSPWEKFIHLSKAFVKDVIIPVGIGTAGGLTIVAADSLIGPNTPITYAHLVIKNGVEDYFLADPSARAGMSLDYKAICFHKPIAWEIFYRIIIHRSIRWMSTKTIPANKKIFGYKIPLADLVASIVSGIFIAKIYYSYGGTTNTIKAALFGMTLGILHDRYGLIASLTAQVVNNMCFFGVLATKE